MKNFQDIRTYAREPTDKFFHLHNYTFNHSRKKRKDSLETRAVLLILSLELEISGVAVQSIHQNNAKW